MFCANCGVKLGGSETVCPLCGVKAYHPDLQPQAGESLYPPHRYPKPEARSRGFSIAATACFVLPLLMTLACDLRFNGAVTWSGYVVGALLLSYIVLILPTWFQRPNPVVFVPCDFAAAAVYLLYVDLVTGGGWFLSFAFPVAGGIGLILTAFTALLRYVRRGRLYLFGGTAMALGAFMLLIEFLLHLTFGIPAFIGWSFYPMAAFVLGGGLLIFLGICRPAREYMERKFFI